MLGEGEGEKEKKTCSFYNKITRMIWVYIMHNNKNEKMYPICVQWFNMLSVKMKKK